MKSKVKKLTTRSKKAAAPETPVERLSSFQIKRRDGKAARGGKLAHTTILRRTRHKRNRGDDPSRDGPDYRIDKKDMKAIEQTVRHGGSLNDAADELGIPRSTMNDTMRRDNGFRKRVTAAVAKGKAKLIKRVHSSKDWKAAIWMLQRKWGHEWGEKLTAAGLDLVQVKKILAEVLKAQGVSAKKIEEACATLDSKAEPGAGEVDIEFTDQVEAEV